VVQEQLLVKFEGEMAEAHRLPAYESAQSFYGISRSLLITLNYLAEGKVRRREFSTRAFQINVVAHRPGSFELVYELITNPTLMTIGGSLGGGIAGNFLTDFIKTIFRRSVGKKGEPTIEVLEAEDKLNPGDVSAVVDAIEPAMRAAHTVINHGAGNIVMISGSGNIVTLDRTTKEYVWSSIRDEGTSTKLFSIASYNGNSGAGRAFDYELGKTIPFEIAKDADRATLTAILTSMSSYAMRRRLGDELKSAVALKYQSVVSIDGRTKKIIILKARQEMADL
jgi:hypothetical protein